MYGLCGPPTSGPSSHSMRSQLSVSRISASLPGMKRSWSVSSMRTMNCPCVWRAVSQAKSAVRTEPKCSAPVGEGANRVRAGRSDSVTEGSVCRCEEDEGDERPRQEADDQQRSVDVADRHAHDSRRTAAARAGRLAHAHD